MMQSFAPTCFRLTRSSLRVKGHLRIAFAPPADADSDPSTPPYLVWTGPSISAETVRDQEPDQESHDTEDVSETFAWPEAMTDHRSVQRSRTATSPGSLLRPGHAAERTRSALQRSRSLPILAALSADATVRLCRFTC